MKILDDVIASEHPSLKGHFPENPVIPAALQVQRIVEAASEVLPRLRICGLTRTRFRAPLKIGAVFQIKLEDVKSDRLKVAIVQGDEVVMTGVLLVDQQSCV